MPLIDIAVARQHVRLDPEITDQDDALTVYLQAAEGAAEDFLNRRIYASQEELDAARLALPEAWAAAEAAYKAAIEVAEAVEDVSVRCIATRAATIARDEALWSSNAVLHGVVINPTIQAGILLTFGHLFMNREDVVTGTSVAQLPIGAQHILMPHRAQMGV